MVRQSGFHLVKQKIVAVTPDPLDHLSQTLNEERDELLTKVALLEHRIDDISIALFRRSSFLHQKAN